MNTPDPDTLFRRAWPMPPEERAAFLDKACANQPSLRREVEAMIEAQTAAVQNPASDDETATLLDANPAGARVHRPQEESSGSTIGHYKLAEKLGEGGFGTVWAAEQREPVKRRVALKIIKLGMDTRQVVARFEAERQALALMDHPNIAKVLDAGATESGRPYFVLELVRGIPITTFCQQRKLGTRERLELFVQVCHAIQHAHQKGVIHRDIKPSNILVSLPESGSLGIPKVIDFGIAKATQQELTEMTIYTQAHQFIGTPAYMSPEQAERSGLDIDTRSDIYSLGVVLYELLTGTTPFEARELMSLGMDAMRKRIREEEPPRPSTRLTLERRKESTPALKGDRQTSVAQDLIHKLRGDLDWIVMKCLEKDRARRYETANGLAADLQRHLSNEPVLARPPSNLYRIQKAVRRNKLAFGAAAAVVLALGLGLAASLWQAIRATRAEQTLQTLFDSERAAKQAATSARQTALAERDMARRHLYAANINLAHQAWLESNLGKARRLLGASTPEPGEEDLREWEWRYLWGLVRGDDTAELARFQGGIFHVAFAEQDRQLLVSLTGSGAEERGGFLFDLGEGKVLNRRALHNQSFNPILSMERQGQILLHRRADNNEGQLLALERESLGETTMFSLNGMVKSLALSPDESLAAAYASSGEVTVVRTADLSLLAAIKAASGGSIHFGRVAFCSDGERLAIGQFGGGLLLVRARTGERLNDWKAHTNHISAIAAAPDSSLLATGAGFSESTIKIWNADTGELMKELTGHRTWIPSLAFSPDGSWLASASADQTIRLWKTDTWQESAVLRGHEDEIYCLAFSSDGRQLVSGSKDGSLRLWSVPPPSRNVPLRVLPETIGYFTFAPNSPRVVTLGADYVVWDGQTGEKLETLSALRGYRAGYDFTEDGRQLMTGGRQGKVRIWDFARHSLSEFDAGGEEDVVAVLTLGGTNGFITVHGQRGDLIKIWDARERKLLNEFKPAGQSSSSVAFSIHGTVATGHGDGSVTLWNSFNGQILTNFPAHRRIVIGLAFSPDGTRLATGGEEGLAKLWDAATFREMAALRGHLKSIHTLSISPTGRRLATGGSGAEAVKFWDIETRQELITLSGGSELLRSLSFSPEGDLLGALTASGRLHLWRAPSWKEIEEAARTETAP